MHLDPGLHYQMQHPAQYSLQRGAPYFDPVALRLAQQQQQKFYVPAYSQPQQHHIPAQALDPYTYGMIPLSYQSLDPRYGGQPMPGPGRE